MAVRKPLSRVAPLDSHPFFPSHVASGRCILSAAAVASAPAVVSAFAAGVPGLCWLWRVPFVRQRCPVVGVPRSCWLLRVLFDGFCRPCTSALRWSAT